MPQVGYLPRQSANISGVVAPGAVIRFYQTATSTPQNAYTDAALQNAVTSLTADAAGLFAKWYLNPNAAADYRYTLETSAGVVYYTEDGISRLPVSQADVGAALYPQTAAEIAVGSTPLHYGYAPGRVPRYGDNTVPGTTNMTSAVNAALAVSDVHPAVFEPETYLVGELTAPPAGAKILLPPGCILKDSGALGTTDRLLNIENDNCHIVGWGAKVQMTRADYTTGEHRHGVAIGPGATNIAIEGLESSDTGGDGFYIFGDRVTPLCPTNISLVGCKADNNRRQGLSITFGRNIRIIDFEGTNTTGTAPSSGIDIEPNDPADILEDIKIIRARCTGNDGSGIQVFLANWNAVNNYADIDIVEPYTADNGAVSIISRLRPGIELNRITSTTPCSGRVRVIDPVCVDEHNAGITVVDWDKNGPLVEIIRPTVINPNQAEGVSSLVSGGIILNNNDDQTTTPGRVRIIDPLVIDDDGFLNANSLTPITVRVGWTDVLITNPKQEYAGASPWSIGNDCVVDFRTDQRIVHSLTTDATVSDGRYLGRTVTNGGASGTVVVSLIAASADIIGWRMRFEIATANQLRIDPNGTNLIRGGTAGQYLASSTIGDNVEIECDSATSWKIVSQYGTWAFV